MVPAHHVYYSKEMPLGQYRQLTPEDVDHFMSHGWIKIKNCFTRKQANYALRDVWARLGISPTDRMTWTFERVNMPGHRDWPVKDFAPDAWAAICDVMGGEERIHDWSDHWDDSWIVNLGTPEGFGKDIRPEGWHVDGDNFVHFLDSPEQGLLVIPLFTDVYPSGGATVICPDAIPMLALHLYDNPQGVDPDFVPRGERPNGPSEDFFWKLGDSMPPEALIEATGNVGDVYLLHPLMLHSVSNNKLRQVRIITNPGVSTREPFRFDRKDPSQYSLVERKTLAALGYENLNGWEITRPREEIKPEREREMEEMKQQEIQRLAEHAARNKPNRHDSFMRG